MAQDRETMLKLKSFLQENTMKIVRVIEANLLMMSLKLKVKGIIPDHLYRKVVHANTSGVDPFSLATQVETSVSTTLHITPRLFPDFIEIVTEHAPDFGEALERKYREIISLEESHRPTTNLPTGREFYERFKRHYTRICSYFIESPDNIAPLADALKNRGLITGATAGSVKFPDGTGPYSKATKMLGPVLHALKDHPEYQEKIISAFRESNLEVVITILESADVEL